MNSREVVLPSISNTGYKVSLLRIEPGRETYVANKHTAAIKKNAGVPPVCTLKLFGRYDLCTIYRTDNYGDGPSKAGPIDGIRGGNKILAFHWGADRSGETLSVESAKGSVWGLLFFRFNESLAKTYGAQIETALAQRWHNAGPSNVTLDLFGTTGWAELLFLIRGEKFSDVIQALGKISQQAVRISNESNPRTVLAPAKTFSLIGVDFELIKPRNRKKLTKIFPEPFETGKGVFPVLNITCPPASMKKVYDFASKKIGAGFITFGANDFVFNCRHGRWGAFIRDVLEMRRSLADDLYSTSVGIMCAGDGGFGKSKSYGQRSAKGLFVSPKLAAQFTKWGPYFEGRLRNLYFGVSNLIQDPLTGECFEDLKLLAKNRLPQILDDLSPVDEDQQKLLDDIIEVIGYAAEERAHGAFLAIEHLESNLSPTKGGIQRVLAAASIIPQKLLARVNKTWYGFLVSGYRNASFSSHYEAINLPFSRLFEPEEWGGLFHETGHAALFDDNFFNIDSPAVTQIIQQAAFGAAQTSLEFVEMKNVFFEIGADLFDLYFCYGEEFELFLLKICPNVIKTAGAIETQYFIRLFIAFEYHKELLRGGRLSFPARLDLSRDFITFRNLLSRLKIARKVEAGAEHAARKAFTALQSAVELLHARFRRVGPHKPLKAELESKETQEIVSTILKGNIWYEPIDSPDTVVIALKIRKAELNLASRLAAIISFWHTAKTSPVTT